MSLYKEIKSHFTLPDAFTDWNNYRNTLTSYLPAQTDRITLPISFHASMEQSEMLPTLAIIGIFVKNFKPTSSLINVPFPQRVLKGSPCSNWKFSTKKAVFPGLEQKRLENDEAIEGAYQAINDIRNRNLQITESGILWPFYPARNISYEMLVPKIVL